VSAPPDLGTLATLPLVSLTTRLAERGDAEAIREI